MFFHSTGPKYSFKKRKNTKLQHKLSLFLCVFFFAGVSEIIFYFFIQYYVITMTANCGKDWFSQIGIGLGSSVQY